MGSGEARGSLAAQPSVRCVRLAIAFLPALAAGMPRPLHASLCMWGSNQYGQLATGGGDASAPVRCALDPDLSMEQPITEMALGGGHSLALDAAGHVWSWGWNGKGQLGVPMADQDGGCQESCRPTRVPGLPRCRKIGAGHESSFAISADGVLFAFGAARGGASVTSSGEGQAFGRGAAAGDTSAHDSLDLSEVLYRAVHGVSGEAHVSGGGAARRQRMRFTDVDAGVFHAAAVTETGECVCWGKYNAQPAPPSATSSPATTGHTHRPPDLAAGDVSDQSAEVSAVISHHSMGVLVWRPSDGAAIVEVACGWKHTVARDNRGRVWGLGDNRRGQLPLHGSSSFDGGAAAAAPDAHGSSGQVRGDGMSGHEPAPAHVLTVLPSPE